MFNAEKKQQIDGDNVNQAGRDLTNLTINNYNQTIKNPDYVASKLPTHLSKILTCLNDDLILDIDTIEYDIVPYSLETKISHNCLIKYKELVTLYGNYFRVISSVYDNLNDLIPGLKGKFMFYIKNCYVEIVGELMQNKQSIERLAIIQENSDLIMDKVYEKLFNLYINDIHKPDLKHEEVEICLKVIICNAFVDCKLLEKPIANATT